MSGGHFNYIQHRLGEVIEEDKPSDDANKEGEE